MKSPKNIITLIIILLIVIVLAQNAKAVDVRFLFWNFSTSAFIMYLIFYVVGVISALIGIVWRKI
ncbi:MAG: hypothetical protein XU11_C0008G0050 [Candidatus Dadabacteria bacterium CSP1-2]|jgi:uncharacterized integral membrane protein|nr:MAG: hypothetical protein XU11_C0008G0050 [Candidatus Dadabacteria bacterium CSP1-2]MBF8301881.1 hypothetical protein [Candidatus Dadabacteria bacterium]OGE23444.1 MAG: hypothetical protein A2V51_03855 [Candidatus Dadabacteria bacterium RBG_19FT_COMBO_40_33]